MRKRMAGLLRGWGDRLTFRLVVLLSMALLPLGAISIHATAEQQRAAQRAGERGLITLARDAVAGERALVESAIATGRSLEAFLLERLHDPAACSALLRGFAERSSIYSFIGVIDAEGTAPCASQPPPEGLGDSPAFRQMLATPLTTIIASPAGRADGQPAITVARPLVGEAGFAGLVVVTIASRSLELMAQRVIEDAPSTAVLINHAGRVLNREAGSPDLALLPTDEALAALPHQPGSRVFRDTSRGGDAAVYALAEVIPGRLYALAMWDRTQPSLRALEGSFLPLLFPAAMWLACLAVVLLAIHYLALTHLKALNRQIRRFALGQREDWPDLPGEAPSEIRELHVTFRNMSRLIARDEEERERALAEKTVLLKEIHHRVKNNLQLIGSVINLQLRGLDDPSARRVLENVQQRVLALASVHRALYSEDRLARVRADRIIADLMARVATIGATPGRSPELRLQLDPLTLEADHMVPLSFLLHETATNALKHSDAKAGGWIEVDLTHEPAAEGTEGADNGTVVLRMRNPLPAQPAAGDGARDGDGLGIELIEAFAMQLDGTCRQHQRDGDGRGRIWEFELRFPAPPGVTAPA